METILTCFEYKDKTIFKQPLTVITDQKGTGNSSLFICLDTSYSMGNDLQKSTQSVISLLDEVYDNFKEVVLFNYSQDTIVQILDKNYSQTLSDVVLRGMTNFIDCIDKVAIKCKQSETDVFVVFLTDGQHNSGGFVGGTISGTKRMLELQSKNVSFHCIGFTSDHDAKLLNSISNMGTNEGTFQYAKDSISLKEAISNIQNVFECRTQKMKLKIKDIAALEFKGGICIVDLPFSKFKDSISLLVDDLEIENIQLQILQDNHFEQLDIFISIQNQILVQITDQVTSSESIDIKVLERIDNDMTSILEDKRFNSLTKVEKALIFERLTQTKKMIGAIYNAHKKNIKNGLTNEDLATLISSSYDHITKRSIKKRLDKRVMSQMDALKESDKKLKEIHSKMNFEEIEKKITKESNEFFKCAISCSNLIESMKEKSSVCLSVKISRNQSAIMDPSQLQIKDIGNTIISTNSFLDSVQFKLESLNLNDEVESIHGGFSGKHGSIVKGVAREDISGIIPLYINKEHWEIQKENIIPVFGWMTTLDIFGYQTAQLRTIPFVALTTFLSTEKLSDFHAISFFQLIRTCRQLYVEHKMRVLDFSILENRLSDVVSNLNLLMGKLLVDDKHYDNVAELILSIIEESFRRRMKSVGDSFSEILLDNLKCRSLVTIRTDLQPHELHEETTQFIEDQFKFEDSNDISTLIQKEIKNISVISKFFLIYKKYHAYFLNDFCDEIDKNSGLPSSTMVKDLKDIFNIDKVDSLERLCEIMDIEKLNKEQLYAVMIQCLNSRTNTSRKEQIEKGLILNPFTQYNEIIDNFLAEQKRMQINNIKSQCLLAYNLENKFEKYALEHIISKQSTNEYFTKMLESPKFSATIFKIHTPYTGSIANRSTILDVDPSNCLKELVITVKGNPVIIVSNGIEKINLDSISKLLNCSEVKFPNCLTTSSILRQYDFSLESVPIFGFENVPVYLNKRILSKKKEEILICASGNPNYLMKIQVGELKKIPNLKFLEFETDYKYNGYGQ